MQNVLSAQKGLLCHCLSRIDGALMKIDDVNDPAQYLFLQTKGEEFSAMVSRPEISAKVVVGKGLQGKVNVSSDGQFVVDGSFVNILSRAADNEVTLSFKENASQHNVKIVEEQEGVGTPAPAQKTIGALLMKTPGISKKENITTFQCFDMVSAPNFESDATTEFSVSGAVFVDAIHKAGTAAGKATMSTDFSNSLIKVSGKKMEVLTSNGGQLAWVRMEALSSSSEVEVCVPYDFLAMVGKMLDSSQPVTISLNKKFKTVIISQEVVYSSQSLGFVVYRIPVSPDKFVSYKHVDKLDFKATCQLYRQQLKQVCGDLQQFDTVRTTFLVDPDAKLMSCDKSEPGRARVEREISLVEASGTKVEVDLSSRHLALGAEAADEEKITLKFSGRGSPALLESGTNFSMYFNSFGKKE